MTFQLSLERILITWKKRQKHVSGRGNDKDKVLEAKKRMCGPPIHRKELSKSSGDGQRWGYQARKISWAHEAGPGLNFIQRG